MGRVPDKTAYSRIDLNFVFTGHSFYVLHVTVDSLLSNTPIHRYSLKPDSFLSKRSWFVGITNRYAIPDIR